jgi:hypothetical protein
LVSAQFADKAFDALIATCRGKAFPNPVVTSLAGFAPQVGLEIRRITSRLYGIAMAADGKLAPVAAAWFLILGGLLAGNAKLSLRATTALAALLGPYHGYLNVTGMGQTGSAAVVLLGLVFAVFVLIALAAAFVVQLRAEWARTAVRVSGKLGCRQRTSDARLGSSNRLRPSPIC